MGISAGLRKRVVVGGLLVPYVVNELATPFRFANLLMPRVARCARERLCGICGTPLLAGKPIYFIGPDDGRTCFADVWMHERCAKISMEQCPFLKGRDWREQLARADPMLQVYREEQRMFYAYQADAHIDARDTWHFRALGTLHKP